MKRLHVGVLGFGRLGRACVEAVLASGDVELVGIVRRPEHVLAPLAADLCEVPVVAHWTEIQEMDVALICLPQDLIIAVAHELLQQSKPIVECAQLHGDAFQLHRTKIHEIALRKHTAAIVGAGWDPGAISIIRNLFRLLAPKGHTETSNRPGISLHHSTWVRSLTGVKDALCTEIRSAAGELQRYVYVEFEQDADRDAVAELIRSDPLSLDTETLVLPVDDVATLEDEGHGIVLERRGAAGRTGHQLLLLEARFDRWALAAQMMVAAARAVASRPAGAQSLLDIPPAAFAETDRVASMVQAI
ncbi:MAG: NAD(P)-binding domain-containing protein [Hyphomicrobiaceae bacterium]